MQSSCAQFVFSYDSYGLGVWSQRTCDPYIYILVICMIYWYSVSLAVWTSGISFDLIVTADFPAVPSTAIPLQKRIQSSSSQHVRSSSAHTRWVWLTLQLCIIRRGFTERESHASLLLVFQRRVSAYKVSVSSPAAVHGKASIEEHQKQVYCSMSKARQCVSGTSMWQCMHLFLCLPTWPAQISHDHT